MEILLKLVLLLILLPVFILLLPLLLPLGIILGVIMIPLAVLGLIGLVLFTVFKIVLGIGFVILCLVLFGLCVVIF